MKRGRKLLTAIFAVAICTGSGLVRAGDSTDVAEQIKKLEAEVAALKAQVKADRAASPTATADAVVQDADSRGLFDVVSPGANSGFDGKNFVLTSPDGSFTLKPGFVIQARDVLSFRDSGKAKLGGSPDDWQSGMEIRRMKLFVTGTTFGRFNYKVQVTNDRNGSGINLDDAYIETKMCNTSDIRVGEYKLPFFHEESGVSDGDGLTAERSLLNDLIGQNSWGARTQGVTVFYHSADPANDPFHAALSMTDGEGAQNTDFRDRVEAVGTTAAVERSRINLAGRIDYVLKGTFSDHAMMTAKGTAKDTAVLGGALSWNDSANQNIYRVTVDGHYIIANKINLYGAWIGAISDIRHTKNDSRFDNGFLVQCGYLLNPKWEAFGRFDITMLDDSYVKADNLISEITIGFNRYLGVDGAAGNKARITLDLSYLPSGPGAADKTGLGYVANRGLNEVVFRAQLQLRM